MSPTQALHTLNIIDDTLVIILPTLPHLSLYIAGTPAIRTLGDSPTKPTAGTQGSHYHLGILKTTAQF